MTTAAQIAIAERREDLEFMARWHETPEGAARRLGMSRNSLATWCRRWAPEVYAQLQENAARRGVRA